MARRLRLRLNARSTLSQSLAAARSHFPAFAGMTNKKETGLPSVRGGIRLWRRGRTTGYVTSNFMGCNYLMISHQPSDGHVSCGGDTLHEPLPMKPLLTKGIGKGGDGGGVDWVRWEKNIGRIHHMLDPRLKNSGVTARKDSGQAGMTK